MDFNCPEEFTDDDINTFGSKDIISKYLKFKTDIMVETDKNLKWCPYSDCKGLILLVVPELYQGYARRVKGCCGYKSRAICIECNKAMCFKCGAVSHPGVSCNKIGNNEIKQFIAKNNVARCPNCNYCTMKDGGCNHMTCVKC